jgi:hypothetical protein
MGDMSNEMARAIVLTCEQWLLLSGTENTDGGLIINLNEMQKHQVSINPRKLVPFTSSNSLHMFYLLFVEVDSPSILCTYVIRAGQCILVVVDMITATFYGYFKDTPDTCSH